MAKTWVRKVLIGLGFAVLAAAGFYGGSEFERHQYQLADGTAVSHLLSNVIGPVGLERPIAPALRTNPCLCRLMWNVCPCGSSASFPSHDYSVWNDLSKIRPPIAVRVSENPRELIRQATGFENISPGRSQGPPEIDIKSSRPFHGGDLSELFVRYERPKQSVRALFAENRQKSRDLLITTNGSWTSAEHVLGLKPEDYYRQIGLYYFRQGFDVLAFDHGSNGTIESFLNVDAVLQDAQIYGVWARSVCDVLDGLSFRERYQRIILYGLSRGGRLVEYISALCPGFELAIVGDIVEETSYQSWFWEGHGRADALKYGAWFFHLRPWMGHLSLADLMLSAQSPMVYTRSEKEHREIRSAFERGFEWKEGINSVAPWRLVFKSGIGHKPELELIDLMLSDRWTEIRGASLIPKPPS